MHKVIKRNINCHDFSKKNCDFLELLWNFREFCMKYLILVIIKFEIVRLGPTMKADLNLKHIAFKCLSYHLVIVVFVPFCLQLFEAMSIQFPFVLLE